MSILNRSPLAAIQFDDGNGKHIRVYYQAPNGDIKEMFYDAATGWKDRTGNVVGRGKLNTGITATCWANGTQIRVYFLDDNNKIVERMYTGGSGWETGGLTNFTAAPFSRIGCTSFDISGARHLRVYYQDTKLKLREIIYRSTPGTGWVEGTDSLPTALVGTSIAAASNPNTPGLLWVYYQDTALNMKETYYTGSGTSWTQGAFSSNKVYPPGAGISATMWNKPPKIRVLTVDQTNALCVTGYDADKWSATKVVDGTTIPDSDVAAISVAGGGQAADAVRVYFQVTGSRITEAATADANAWTIGNNIL